MPIASLGGLLPDAGIVRLSSEPRTSLPMPLSSVAEPGRSTEWISSPIYHQAENDWLRQRQSRRGTSRRRLWSTPFQSGSLKQEWSYKASEYELWNSSPGMATSASSSMSRYGPSIGAELECSLHSLRKFAGPFSAGIEQEYQTVDIATRLAEQVDQ